MDLTTSVATCWLISALGSGASAPCLWELEKLPSIRALCEDPVLALAAAADDGTVWGTLFCFDTFEQVALRWNPDGSIDTVALPSETLEVDAAAGIYVIASDPANPDAPSLRYDGSRWSPLGPPRGADAARAVAVEAGGDAAGAALVEDPRGGPSISAAVRWSDLIAAPIPGPFPRPRSAATALAAAGHVVGQSFDGGASDSVQSPWRRLDGETAPLPIPAPLDSAFVRDINDAGIATGWGRAGDGPTVALCWGLEGVAALPLPVGADAGVAEWITDSGRIVGTVSGGGAPTPWFWPAFDAAGSALGALVEDREGSGDAAILEVVDVSAAGVAVVLLDDGTWARLLPRTRFGDLTGDCRVDGADLGLLLAAWKTDGGEDRSADLNGDGVVEAADLGLLLGAWTIP